MPLKGAIMPKHFIDIFDNTPETIRNLLIRAIELKKKPQQALLTGQTLGMIFQKPSTRTRVSFESGMYQLGGHVINLLPEEVGLGARELPKDVARVMSRFVDAIMIRTFEHSIVKELAQFATIPVINGLSDHSHPCQAMADAQTIIEHFGRWEDVHIVYLGDGNNVCLSLIELCMKLNWTITVACPEGYEPRTNLPYILERDPQKAVETADVIYTDVWASMGQEDEKQSRIQVFKVFQINETLMARAKEQSIFMHCLPAYRGLEVTDGVIESRQSVVFDQAENRLHAQKAILLHVLEK